MRIALPDERGRAAILRVHSRKLRLADDGEIEVAGPMVMRGYWTADKLSAEAFNGRFFRPGDLGAFDEAGALMILAAPADATPPVEKPHLRLAGCRNVTDVLSDLKAQVAANAKGIALLHELIREHGRRAVLSYMGHVQDNAAACVRSMLREYAARIRADGEATLDELGQVLLNDDVEVVLGDARRAVGVQEARHVRSRPHDPLVRLARLHQACAACEQCKLESITSCSCKIVNSF